MCLQMYVVPCQVLGPHSCCKTPRERVRTQCIKWWFITNKSGFRINWKVHNWILYIFSVSWKKTGKEFKNKSDSTDGTKEAENDQRQYWIFFCISTMNAAAHRGTYTHISSDILTILSSRWLCPCATQLLCWSLSSTYIKRGREKQSLLGPQSLIPRVRPFSSSAFIVYIIY